VTGTIMRRPLSPLSHPPVPLKRTLALVVTPVTPVSLSKGRFSPEMERRRSRFDRNRIRRTSASVLLSEPGSLSERETLQKHLCPTAALRRVGAAVQLSRHSWQKRGIVHGRAPEEPRSIRTGAMWIESHAPRGSYRTRPAGAQLSRSAAHEHP
jgi:hypothetical protein